MVQIEMVHAFFYTSNQKLVCWHVCEQLDTTDGSCILTRTTKYCMKIPKFVFGQSSVDMPIRVCVFVGISQNFGWWWGTPPVFFDVSYNFMDINWSNNHILALTLIEGLFLKKKKKKTSCVISKVYQWFFKKAVNDYP